MAVSLSESVAAAPSVRVRMLAVLAAALMAVALVASPAHASGYQEGSRACGGSTPFSALTFRASGSGWANAPGSVPNSWFNHAGYQTSSRSGALYGGSWWVSASVGVNGEATYGWCSSMG